MYCDGAAFLARSPIRIELLAALREGPLDGRELRDRLDASRTTVSRSLDRMGEHGWVIETTGGYRLTALGGFLAAEFEDLLDAFAAGDDLAPFLRRVPDGAFDLDPWLLADARVTVATQGQPLAPIDRVTTIREQSDSLREVADVIAAESAEQMTERADPDSTVEVVLTADAVDVARSNPDYRDAFQAVVEGDAVDFYRLDDTIPFVLTLLDDRVALGVTDDRGAPAALVESRDEAVREWAERRFETYLDAAEPLG